MILAHDLLTNKRTKRIFSSLEPTDRIIDVGCGIRPCPAFPCKQYICIEPHYEYADVLRQWQLPYTKPIVVQEKAEELSRFPRKGTTVLMLDVIEHLPRGDGESMIRLLEEFDHAVVFTPLGWYEQGQENPDAWGFNGGYWQQHRSAWQPSDFDKYKWTVTVWPVWHPKNKVGAILAVR